MTSKISDDVIKAVVKAGFDVYMRDAERDTWLIFTDGTNLGYLQNCPMYGVSLSTVHVPNSSTGTGFRVADRLDTGDLTRQKLAKAFLFAPNWASDRNSVRKWRNMDAYRASSSFNAEYERVVTDGMQIERT